MITIAEALKRRVRLERCADCSSDGEIIFVIYQRPCLICQRMVDEEERRCPYCKADLQAMYQQWADEQLPALVEIER